MPTRRKRKAQSAPGDERPQKRATVHFTSVNKKLLETNTQMSADPSQGAYEGTRSRSRAATPASVAPTANNSNAVSIPTPRTILKPQSRKAKKVGSQQTTNQQSIPQRVSSASPLIDSEPGPVLSTRPHPNGINDPPKAPAMSSDRPKLTLKFPSKTGPQSAAQTPHPQSTGRTPSIKLSFKREPQDDSPANLSHSTPREVAQKNTTPNTKKRKQPVEDDQDSSDDERRARPAPTRKLTFKQPKPPRPSIQPLLKIKQKGKKPKRLLGVGYDSELSDREDDPVILEAFILRMQPGEDCDYLKDAIEKGLIGVSRNQGGADFQLKILDHHGRRAVVTIRGRKYAAALVDLPCIIEGMKSWDRKGWIKSVDVSQMLLVLGRIETEEQAKDFKLPVEVDSRTFQYAHGLTPPMRWVRKRRFARTNRAQISDIEAVERRVHQLLQDDAQALHVKYELLDPMELEMKNRVEGESSEYDDYEDEEHAEETPGDYFAPQHGAHGEFNDTPTYVDTPAEEVDQAEVDELENLMASSGDDGEQPPRGPYGGGSGIQSGLQPPEGDSSFAVTSNSASPSAVAAETPAVANVESSDEDEEDDNESDVSTPESIDDAEKEGTENLQQTLDKIQEMEEKIKEQMEQMKAQKNAILQRKILQKISALQGDVEQMKKTAGLDDDD